MTLPALLAQAGMAALLALHATAAATPAGRAPLAMVLGYVDRTDFLAQKVPDNFTPALLWMQTQAQREAAGGRALLVGLHQGYHLRFPHLAGDFFNPCPLLTWAEGADTVEALEARLAAEGITHVIFTGETLANPAYHFWFLLHALPEPEVREALAGRGAVPLARAASTPAYRVISAWLAAAPGLVRVYPEADPPPALAPTPWNLPASTVIYRRNSQSSPEVSENTHLRP